MAVSPVPEGYHSITPYLIVRGAAEALDFYREAFGATEVMRFDMPGGKVGHAEIRIGDSVVMLADEVPEMAILAPQSVGGSPVTIHLYCDDVDAVFARALAAGAEEVWPVRDQFYGDRSGKLTDPFGHIWGLATHTEDLSPDELEKRFQAMMDQGCDEPGS